VSFLTNRNGETGMKKTKTVPKRKSVSSDENSLADNLELPVHEPLEEDLLEIEKESVSEIEETLRAEEPIDDLTTRTETLKEDIQIPDLVTETDPIPEIVDQQTKIVLEPKEPVKPKVSFWHKNKDEKTIEEIIQKKNEARKEEEVKTMKYEGYAAGASNEDLEAGAVISRSMVIKGDMELETSLLIAGKIIGNIICKDHVETNEGSVIEGNVKAKSINFVGGEIKGNVECEERLVIDDTTVITGNILAKTVTVSGKVTGEIKAQESVVLARTAAVKGDLISASLSVEAGAKLDGKYSVNSDSID
jgi:cytoskeletal protein CcmA (bactofilin family)